MKETRKKPEYMFCTISGNYIKLFSFLLIEYTRVIEFDSDGFAFASLDHLFLLRFPHGVHIASPQAYWLDDDADGVTIGTADNCPGTLSARLP
jgi:alpha-N-acetylglucosamine transferase